MKAKMDNDDLFTAMVDAEWSVVYHSFHRFIRLYQSGQAFENLPEQASEKRVDEAREKFREIMELLDYR